MASPIVSLKGTQDGLLITIGKGAWPQVMTELASQLERPRAAQFFRGARARLASGERTLSESEITELTGLLEQHAMQLDLQPPAQHPRVRTRVETSADAAETLVANDAAIHGLPEGSSLEGIAVSDKPELWIEAALVRRTVRSGQVIRYPGHVIVHGDVNPGAEIVASGDVIIWGKLRGMVHAGASGDDKAVVGALLLAPMQLRIGNHIARAPDERGKKDRGAEIARVRDGRIVIESWKVGKD